MASHQHPEAGLSNADPLKIPYEQVPVDLIGRILEKSCGTWGDLKNGYVVRNFSLVPWQPSGGKAQSQPLTVLQRVEYDGTPDEDGEDDEWWAAFWEHHADGDVIGLKVWISISRHRSVVISSRPASTEEVQAIQRMREASSTPDTLSLNRHGELTFDQLGRVFQGSIAWGKESIQLSLELDQSGSPESARKRALQLLRSRTKVIRDAVNFAARELLATKNEVWLDDDESPLEANEFVSRLVLTAVDVDADGSFSISFDDGGLFAGHSIRVSATRSGWDSADLQG